MDSSTGANVALQNNNTDIVADKKVEASRIYQGEMNNAFEGQAAENIAAINGEPGSPHPAVVREPVLSFPAFVVHQIWRKLPIKPTSMDVLKPHR